MIEWKEKILIKANIETVWDLFKDENIHLIMPKVEEHTLIEKTQEEIGAKHRQSYREGKRVETYIIETLDYVNQEEYKYKHQHLILGKSFEIDLKYMFRKKDAHATEFTYEGSNKGANFVGRAMLKLGSDKANKKVVHEFLNRVEKEALKSK